MLVLFPWLFEQKWGTNKNASLSRYINSLTRLIPLKLSSRSGSSLPQNTIVRIDLSLLKWVSKGRLNSGHVYASFGTTTPTQKPHSLGAQALVLRHRDALDRWTDLAFATITKCSGSGFKVTARADPGGSGNRRSHAVNFTYRS